MLLHAQPLFFYVNAIKISVGWREPRGGSGGKEGREVIREREENSRLLRVDPGSRFEKSFKAH